MEQYSTNLPDKQWQVIEKIICPQDRKRKYPLRNILNAVLYLLKTGCQWRMIPKDFAPWQSVYYYFCKWKNEGIMEELLDKLRSLVRMICGRNESPGMGIIDSRSVKTSKVLRKSLKNCPVSFPALPKFLLMEAIEETLPIGSSTNTDGNLKSFSDRMNVRQSSRSFQNDGLWKELLLGWKILED